MKRFLSILLLIFSICFVFGKEFPDEYYVLRDVMYNCEKSAAEFERDVNVAMEKAEVELSGYDLNLSLARYEYIIGRAYSYEKNTKQAAVHFDRGMTYAKAAIDEKESAQGYLIYAENIGGNCASKPFTWVIIWGPKVSGIAKKVLKFDSKSGAGHYMQNAQDIYAPKAFGNYKRGLQKMSSLLNNPNVVLYKDDEFNVKSAIGYAHLKLGKVDEALPWLEESIKIYPGNKFVKNLLETKSADDVVAGE